MRLTKSAHVSMPLTTYLLLFRGVGGATQLPVVKLRLYLSVAGLRSVTTYINSGNAVVRSVLPRERVIEIAAEVCRRKFDFDKPIFAPTLGEWKKLVANNPFPEAVDVPKHLHAAVLQERPKPGMIEMLRTFASPRERIEVVGNVAYLHTPDGFGTSKLAAKFDKGIGVVNTARNWNTVLKLLEIAEGLGGK